VFALKVEDHEEAESSAAYERQRNPQRLSGAAVPE
jgi:hypothetical protein